jgi:hypothetical protein
VASPELNTTQQPVAVTITEPAGSRAVGIAGYTAVWDTGDPGDPTTLPNPAAFGVSGPSEPFLDGPGFVFTGNTGPTATGIVPLEQGCHTLYVRAWDNDGLGSALATAGPYCFADCDSPGQVIDYVQCGSTCCAPGSSCLSGSVANPCCPGGQQACGSACCPVGQTCMDAATSQCGTPVCAPPTVPVGCSDGSNNVMCCSAGATCCNGACCTVGQVCCGVLGCQIPGSACNQ